MELIFLCLAITGIIFIIAFYFAIMIFITYEIKINIENNSIRTIIQFIFLFLYITGGMYGFISLTDLKNFIL
jgi:hypothetical protein